MDEAAAASEARMRAAVRDVVTTLDGHDGLAREEAVPVLDVVVGTYALAQGDAARIVLDVDRIALRVVHDHRDLAT